MEQKTTTPSFEDKPKEQDFIKEYTPHACCMGFVLSAAIMCALIYFIYLLIKSLI